MIKKVVYASLVVSALAAPSFADLAIEFSYAALTGKYTYNDPTNRIGTLTVWDTANSIGHVDRMLPTLGMASFYPGNAEFSSNLVVKGITPSTAIGEGTMSMTDINGTTLDLVVSGMFIPFGNRIFFNGIITQAAFGGSGELFEGDTGSFSTAFTDPLSDGTIVQFNYEAPWFSTIPGYAGFSGKLTKAEGEIYTAEPNNTAPVPAPAALAMAGIGLGCVGWVKRRFT